ncbi:MAG: class I SAM-dependent methyltransferase [Candidatus Sabulitectum sp.]|nr:class I SAM-dependent methyltransferase [Candidatus Sabulitectum sp.]
MSILKSLVRKAIPVHFIACCKRLRQLREEILKRDRTAEQISTEIYKGNLWGGARGDFCSGDGTANQQIGSTYINMVRKMAESEFFFGLTFVDLGCGDFRVGERLLSLCSIYKGIDIVEPLISKNSEKYGNSTPQFQQLNIVNDELPNGEVVFLRQVLQHLSNGQICSILPKLKRCKWVFITKHYPTDNSSIIPNIDQCMGGGVRVYKNSGVYLSKPPFDLPKQTLIKALEALGCGLGKNIDPGVIRTFLYKPI